MKFLILVFLITLFGSALTVSAANLPACKYTHVCMYKDANRSGAMVSYSGNDKDYSNGGWRWRDNTWDHGGRSIINSSINNKISSVWNKGSRCSTNHYWGANYTSVRFFLKRNYYARDLKRSGDGDKFTSHKWC